jgi:hypothetical protein
VHDVTLDAFGKDVTLALQSCVPTGIQPSQRVEVLFVTWKDEDQNCTDELLMVDKAFTQRGYNANRVYLPTNAPVTFLMARLLEWGGGGKSVLKIFFIAGMERAVAVANVL